MTAEPGRPAPPAALDEILDRFENLSLDDQLAAFDDLVHVAEPRIRQRALRAGAAILSDRRLLDYLRDADDVRRNAAVEILKLRRRRAFNLASFLLDDRDSAVVLQAVTVLRDVADSRAVSSLVRVLRHEDPNVRQEAIIALGRIGDVRALPALLPFLEHETWVQAAAVEAIGRLGGPAAVPALRRVLDDPAVGPLAGEALARIGGLDAAVALAEHWLGGGDATLDTVRELRRLGDLLEALACPAPDVLGLEDALEDRVRAGGEIRFEAVRCLMALRGNLRGLWMF